MTTIDPSRIVALLRAVDTKISAGDQADSQRKLSASESGGEHRVRRRFDRENLKEKLRSRISVLDKNSPDYMTNVADLLVREVVKWQFGERVTSHPEYPIIVSKITQSLVSDNALLDQLLSTFE